MSSISVRWSTLFNGVVLWSVSTLLPPATAMSAAPPALLYTVDGVATGDNFGTHVNGVIGAPGGSRILIGARSVDANGMCNTGGAYVVQAATGSQIYWLPGHAGNGDVYPDCGHTPGEEFGRFTGVVRDIDGDGVDDLIIGAPMGSVPSPRNPSNLLPKGGKVYVYSGRDGHLIYTFNGPLQGIQMGRSVESVPDVNGDGIDEILAGAPGNADGSGSNNTIGRAYLYSGKTGQLLYSLQGEGINDQFGFYLTGIGDIDGDGRGDFIVGARFGDPLDPATGQTLTDAGIAYVYSGATGRLLYRLQGERSNDAFGASVGSVGDINGDGVPDFVVGASQASPIDPGTGQTKVNAGRIYVYSGKTATVLFTIDGIAAGDGLGTTFATHPGLDVDGDGTPDILAGLPLADVLDSNLGILGAAGRVRAYSGTSGQLLFTLNGNKAVSWFGTHLDWVRSVDGGSVPGLIVGARREDVVDPTTGGTLSSAGRVYVYSVPAGSVVYPTPTSTPTPVSTSTPTPTATNTPIPSPTATNTDTPTPTVTATPTPTVTDTPTPTVTATPTPTVTDTPTPAVTDTPTPTSSVTDTPTPAVTDTPTPTVTDTPTPAVTDTPTPTPGVTDTPAPTATPTPTVTSTPTPTVAQGPTASFTFSPSSPTAGQSVQFTDTSTDATGTLVFWGWNFGDGKTASSRNPGHVFASAGTYSVTLRVRDNIQAVSQTTQVLVVSAP